MAGFWLMPRDAGRTLGEVAAAKGAVRLTCAACRHARLWWAGALAAMPRDTAMADIARRCVCAACGSRLGVLSVLTPRRPRRGGPRRLGHVTERDLARIRALAEQVTPDHRPPVLDDLDAPIRVGAIMPGDEAHEGGTVFGAWAGRVLVGWRLPQSAKNARRKVGR